MNEIWKDVEGYEGSYQVSNLGRVRSLDRVIKREHDGKVFDVRRKGKMMSLIEDKDGYLKIFLSRKTKQVHRIVAEAFHPNPYDLPVVNHINGIKDDNRVENLEWVTRKENTLHAFKTGLMKPMKGSNHGMSKLTEEDVKKIKELLAEGEMKQADIAIMYNISQNSIYCIKTGKAWAHVC